jgi:MEMO1 family protein
MVTSIRKASFAGRFYPADKQSLSMMIEDIYSAEKEFINVELAQKRIIGGIVPHAGIVFSGYQAIHFYAILKQSDQQIDTFVIINPNHSGLGKGMFNISNYDFWETPLGLIEIDREFSAELDIEVCNQAHDNEHSGEVQLSFIKYFHSPQPKVVLITMNQQDVESALILAQKIKKATEVTNKKVILVASSDFSHYETPEIGFRKDQFVVDAILKLDAEQVYSEVKSHQVTVCGFGPIMTLINFAKMESENSQLSILKRGHSGEVHPSTEVVDYISFLCFEK